MRPAEFLRYCRETNTLIREQEADSIAAGRVSAEVHRATSLGPSCGARNTLTRIERSTYLEDAVTCRHCRKAP